MQAPQYAASVTTIFEFKLFEYFTNTNIRITAAEFELNILFGRPTSQ